MSANGVKLLSGLEPLVRVSSLFRTTPVIGDLTCRYTVALPRIGEFLDLGVGDAEVLEGLHGNADPFVGKVGPAGGEVARPVAA